VFGVNGNVGVRQGRRPERRLRSRPVQRSGYDEIDGHTLYSTALPPGHGTSAYTPSADGLPLHRLPRAARVAATQYRNLLNRGIFTGDSLTYRDRHQRPDQGTFTSVAAATYTVDQIDFNEPSPRRSGVWQVVQSCHQDFHGQGGDANMGGVAGGVTSTNATPWKRPPHGPT